MATDKRQFTMRMQPENFDKIKVIAALSKRSIAMQIEYLLERCIKEYESVNGKIDVSDDDKSFNYLRPKVNRNIVRDNLHHNLGGTNILTVTSR